MSITFRPVTVLLAACVIPIAISGVNPSAFADDWAQWMGPTGDGVYRESGIIDAIPEQGLEVRWRTPIQGGYAGPAVSDGRVFVFDYTVEGGESFNRPDKRATLRGRERLLALDATDGSEIWTYEYECPYSISYPAGPRCTPTIDGDRVYILGSEGDLTCLQAADGRKVWSTSLKRDFKAEVPMWGFASHPLVDGELLYTMVGGTGQGVVAFDKMTGAVRWQALDCKAGYSPPSLIDFGGVRQLIVYHPEAVCSLNPQNGDEYWQIAIAPRFEMSICRPMIDGNRLYASGLGHQSVMIELTADPLAAKELWRGTPKISVYGATATPLFVDGVLYGSDCHTGQFMAVDALDGNRLWETFDATRPEERRRINHGTGFVTRIGDSNRYFIMNEVGELILAELTKEKYSRMGGFHVLEPTGEAHGREVVWSHPAYANRTAYIRNDKEIVAVSLSQDQVQ